MITKIKIFEENKVPYFSVGDEVLCILSYKVYGNSPKKDNIYLVLEIYDMDMYNRKSYYNHITKENINEWYVNVKDVETGVILLEWKADRFILPTPEELKELKMTKTANKFNI